jgi:hypothetical protein
MGHRPALLPAVVHGTMLAPMHARIADDELPRLLELLGEADSVELKVTVPDSDRRSAVEALGIDPVEAEIRQVFFFDTPDLDLYRQGVVVRARRARGRGDTVVKLRPVVPGELPAALRDSRDFGIEVDAMPGSFICSGSLKGSTDPQAIREAAAGERPARKLFSKPQRALYREHAPDGLDLDELCVLGPVQALRLKFTPPELGRRMTAELWVYPDDSRVLELSTKCAPGQTFQVAAETRAHLASHGALEFFSARIQATARPG